MWSRMDRNQLNQMLDERIANHGKLRWKKLGLGSLSMFVVSVILNTVYFIYFTPFSAAGRPVEYDILLRITVFFVFLELITGVALLYDEIRFSKMDLFEKREFLLDGIRRKKTRICPQCKKVFTGDEVVCPECGNALDMLYEYRWIEDSSNDAESTNQLKDSGGPE
jgi:hypothetical protein